MTINAEAVDTTADHFRRLLAVADQLAPAPKTRDAATARAWIAHYAAQAMAAHSTLRAAMPGLGAEPGAAGSRPDHGYLMTIANASLAAALALDCPHRDETPGFLWDLTPELGSLNGEHVEWLADVLVQEGINPADLHPWYSAADFNPPSRLAELDPTLPEALLGTAKTEG
jgi:hypothetical protein